MSDFTLRRKSNKDRSLCHVINFLTANKIMSLEDSRAMFWAFHSGEEDVVVAVPDALDSSFMDALDAVDFRFEKNKRAGDQCQ